MEQKNIRPWNNNQYSAQEGADLIQELHDRTKSTQEGYNSIDELATKVKTIESSNSSNLRKDGYRWIKGDANSSLAEYEVGDEIIGSGTLFPGYLIHGYINTSPMTDVNSHISILNSTPL